MAFAGEAQKTRSVKRINKQLSKIQEKLLKIRKRIAFIGAFKGPCTLP